MQIFDLQYMTKSLNFGEQLPCVCKYLYHDTNTMEVISNSDVLAESFLTVLVRTVRKNRFANVSPQSCDGRNGSGVFRIGAVPVYKGLFGIR